MTETKTIACPFCGLRFTDENARWQHARDVHRDKGKQTIAALRPSHPDDDGIAGWS